MNWNEEFARANAGKMILVTFYGVPIRGRVVGFSNDKQDISDQEVLCATDMGIAASSRIAPFHKAKRSYTLMASVLHDDYVFTFHKWDANKVVFENDVPTTPKESPVHTRDFTAEELKLSAKDFAEMFAGAYVQHCASERRYFVGAYRSERVVLSSLKGGKLDEVYWTPVCENPNAGETISVCNMDSFVLEILAGGYPSRAHSPLRPRLSTSAANAPSGNPDAKAWQDAWNAKFKTYNRMTSFLANLSMKNFPIELERERHEIVHLAMKEINPKAVENDAKAFNEMAAKIKDR